MTIEVFGVEHIDLTISDLHRSIAFYEKVFGTLGFRRVSPAMSGGIVWTNGHISLGLHAVAPEEKGTAFSRYRVGLHHLALKAKSRADVDKFYQWLLQEGVPILEGPPAEYPQYGRNYYAVFFADPDGMKLEVVHFPWGYWKRAQITGRDERPRYAPDKT